jgi:small nuclear ribonucleoprotein (snRNP)-like protein
MAQRAASCLEAASVPVAACAPGSGQASPAAFGRTARDADSSSSRDAPQAAQDEQLLPEEKKSLAQRWAESFQGEGPLGAAGLGNWRWRLVRVVVRRQYGVRGWYEGRLTAYDRHWNMLLTDVTEQAVAGHCPPPTAGGAAAHVRPRRGGGEGVEGLHTGGGSGAPRGSVSPAGTPWRRTSIPQLLLRGDSVVSVCDARVAANAARSQNCSPNQVGSHAGGPGLVMAAFERLGLAALEMARAASERGSISEHG